MRFSFRFVSLTINPSDDGISVKLRVTNTVSSLCLLK